MAAENPSLAVVYLLRKGGEAAFLDRFLESYRRMKEPRVHDLVVVFKGFEGPDKAPYAARLSGLPHVSMDVDDRGFDLGSYLEVARQCRYDRFCFLNTYSVILASNWLHKLNAVFERRSNAGIVGASGSWEPIGPETPFPNYHIRTTGFLISRALFLDLETWPMNEKRDANLFEAGPNGVTRQILKRGLEPYVVDRDGEIFAKEAWSGPPIFRNAGQEKLLIGDNRTEAYDAADPETQVWLRNLAWSSEDAGPDPHKKRGLARRFKKWRRALRQGG
ncbi:hypothetical protein [Varunaivibrio sulfuroxidans]|uniref:Glycosyl transferase family 2 n=1 Tax=Varunaivibrio sulfuroxidans TaxID=1773489 RepID=A0A4R3JI99_9PROT|nr:hypothetical protein [Varunaivibrio sulfuroxidans]TCS64986.1 hypothetical protein EDD55_101318 [Varunaivibrio sulfuroxidans]WES29724.1 hypothetical protein P3M64_08680 [Varunaivibrio sulfuroxidans]